MLVIRYSLLVYSSLLELDADHIMDELTFELKENLNSIDLDSYIARFIVHLTRSDICQYPSDWKIDTR